VEKNRKAGLFVVSQGLYFIFKDTNSGHRQENHSIPDTVRGGGLGSGDGKSGWGKEPWVEAAQLGEKGSANQAKINTREVKKRQDRGRRSRVL